MSDAFVRDLRAAAQAGVPIVCVVTHEERRAVTLVGQALRGARAGEPARALSGNSQTLPQRNTQ